MGLLQASWQAQRATSLSVSASRPLYVIGQLHRAVSLKGPATSGNGWAAPISIFVFVFTDVNAYDFISNCLGARPDLIQFNLLGYFHLTLSILSRDEGGASGAFHAPHPQPSPAHPDMKEVASWRQAGRPGSASRCVCLVPVRNALCGEGKLGILIRQPEIQMEQFSLEPGGNCIITPSPHISHCVVGTLPPWTVWMGWGGELRRRDARAQPLPRVGCPPSECSVGGSQ